MSQIKCIAEITVLLHGSEIALHHELDMPSTYSEMTTTMLNKQLL